MNSTQLLGIFGFGIAGLLSLGVRRTPWIAIGLISLFFCLECVMSWRHQFHVAMKVAMGSYYAERLPLQIALIAGGAILAIIIATILLRTIRDRPTRVAMTGTLMATALFALETISLHEIDAILYSRIGPVLLIAWIWVGLSGAIGSAAIVSIRRGRMDQKKRDVSG